MDGYPWNAGQGHRQATGSRADIENLQGATRNATGPLSEPIPSLQGQYLGLGPWHQNITGDLNLPFEKRSRAQDVLQRLPLAAASHPSLQLLPVLTRNQ